LKIELSKDIDPTKITLEEAIKRIEAKKPVKKKAKPKAKAKTKAKPKAAKKK
jgi:DNA topoisomerase-1